MKIFASLLILASLASTIYGKAIPESVALLTKGLHQECVAESKVTEEIIEDARAGKFSEQPEFKCYLSCLLTKMNLISKSGVFNFDGMISIMPPDVREAATKVINSCRDMNITGEDNCERAFNLNTCIYNANPEGYFLV